MARGNPIGRLCLAATLTCSAMASQADPILIKFSHVVAEDTPKGKGARKFEELAEEYTDGAVDVEIYPNSVLYRDREELEALQLGSVQMIAPSLSKFGPLGFSQFEIFDLPYLFRGIDDVHRITQGPIGAELLGLLKSRGVTGLAFWDNGFKIFSATTPIMGPESLQGLSMRVQASRVLEEEMRALGAVPRVMALSEVRDALETAWVEGTENAPSNMLTQDIFRLQPHAVITNHGYLGYAVLVNSAFWDQLDPAIREDLERAMDEATRFTNAIAVSENEAALEVIREAGTTEIRVPDADETRRWREALLPLHLRMRDWVGGELYDRVAAEVGGTETPTP